MKTRILVTGVIVLSVGSVAVMGVLCATRGAAVVADQVAEPVVVRCMVLERRPYTITETFYGLIEADTTIDLSFPVGGKVARLGDHGDSVLGSSREAQLHNAQRVERGQVLAELELMRFRAAADQVAAQAEQAKAQLAAAQVRINDATARLADAKREVERYRGLVDKNVANQRELDKALLAQQIAQAQVDLVESEVSAAAATYEAARAAGRVANIDLDDATILAPFTGVVSKVHVELSQTVQAGQPVVTLLDLNRVKLKIGVVERKVSALRQGQAVTVEIHALAAESTLFSDRGADASQRLGRVAVVPPAADPVTGLFDVEIELDNADGLLRPGMIGKATVQVQEKSVVAIPAAAAVRTDRTAWAFFIGEADVPGAQAAQTVAQRLMFRPLVFDNDYYLLDGLPQGRDVLIVEGQQRFSHGDPVTVVDLESAPVTGAASASVSDIHP